MTLESPFRPPIDTQEAAEIAGLPYTVMLGLRRTGKGPKSVRVGRKYLYDFDSVIEWRKNLFVEKA